MQDRPSRYDSRDRRGSSSSRSSSYDRSSRRGSSSSRGTRSNVSSERRRDMGSIRDERRRNGTPSRQRLRDADTRMTRGATSSRNRGMRTPQGGYKLSNRPINFAGKRGGYDPQLIIVAGVAIAVIILIIFFIVSCAASCGAPAEPTANVSEALSGDLRTSVEELVTSDYQSTYVAEHADQYPTDLIQLMVDEPASTEFVFNYPTASREAQSYDEQVAKGSVPLLYDWDARWGYVEYAGSVIGVTGSGPTSVAMARMGLLGSGDATPATIADYVTQLGGATGDSFMDAAIFSGSDSSGDSDSSSSTTDGNDADGDGYDDDTGEYLGADSSTDDSGDSGDSGDDTSTSPDSGGDLASMIGLIATPITVEPGTSVTDTMLGFVDDGSYVLVETSSGPFGETPHWMLIIGANSDGSLAIYDPTSVANSLHPWDPGTVIDGSSSLVALSAPGGNDDEGDGEEEHVDEDGDGYDDVTGVYFGDEQDGSDTDADADSSSDSSSDGSSDGSSDE